MESNRENIDNLVIKIKVLESKIQRLESQAEEVIQDVNTEFRQQIKELNQKKEAAKQTLLIIQEARDKG